RCRSRPLILVLVSSTYYRLDCSAHYWTYGRSYLDFYGKKKTLLLSRRHFLCIGIGVFAEFSFCYCLYGSQCFIIGSRVSSHDGCFCKCFNGTFPCIGR